MALFLACRNGELSLMKKILEEHDIDINRAADTGQASLLVASIESQVKIFQVYDPKRTKLDLSKGTTALQICCTQGHAELVRHLLTLVDIDVYKRDSSLWTVPLYYACHAGHAQVVKYLLLHPSIQLDPQAFWVACDMNRPEVVKLLIARPESDVNGKTLSSDRTVTPLAAACFRGYQDIVKILLSNVDIDVNYHHKYPAIMRACRSGNLTIVKHILARPDLDTHSMPRQGLDLLAEVCFRNQAHLVPIHRNYFISRY